MIYGVDYTARTMGGKQDSFSQSEPVGCGSCGRAVLELKPCVSDSTTEVGSCCETYIDPRCPDCGSDQLRFEEYDFGIDPDTGYHDAGVRAICLDCGCTCDERDAEVKIGPMPTLQAALYPQVAKKPAGVELARHTRKENA